MGLGLGPLGLREFREAYEGLWGLGFREAYEGLWGLGFREAYEGLWGLGFTALDIKIVEFFYYGLALFWQGV